MIRATGKIKTKRYVSSYDFVKNQKGPLGKINVGGRIILKLFLRELEWSGMNWIDVAQDRDQWRPLVNTAMKFRFL
jgi:hypothetical protein